MQQLKKALMDAGMVTEKDIAREKVKKAHLKSDVAVKSDQLRIVCDVCGKTAPDVERYQHKNRMIEGKQWLCIPCADLNCINDECRMTNQSSQAKTKMFRRQYGRTKRF